MLIKSLYTHIFATNGKYYLYNTQTSFFSEISEEFYNALLNNKWGNLPDEVITKLTEQEIILDESKKYDYFNLSQLRFYTSCYNSELLSLIIAPTTACNFECPYCFEPKKTYKTIDQETIDKLIDFILSKKSSKQLILAWYGGEPLLAFDKMMKIYDLIIEKTEIDIIHHSIVTNGYLISDDVISFFEQSKLNHIQITLDGIKEHHDHKRYIKNTHLPTFDRIYDNILTLSSRLPELKISVRVNVNKENKNDFLGVYNLFKDSKNIYVYPGLIREETSDHTKLSCESYSVKDIFDLYYSYHLDGTKVRFFPKPKQNKGCMIQQLNSFIVGPEGELYKCWSDVNNPERIIGNIDSPEIIIRTRFLRYMSCLSPFDIECKECTVFPLCSGGCGYFKYKNQFENGKFDQCSPFKDIKKLEKSLILSLGYKKDEKINLNL